MKTSFSINALTTLAARIMSALCTIAAAALIARVFGPQGSGVYALAAVFSGAAATLALFGANTATIFYTGKKKYSIGQIIANNIFFSLFAGGLAVAAGLPLAIIFAGDFLRGLDLFQIFLAAASIIPIVAFNLLSHILIGLEEIRVFNRISLFQSALLVGLIFVFAVGFGLGVETALAAYALSFLFSSLLFAGAAARVAGGIVWKFNFDYIKDILSYGAKIYPTHVFSFLNSRANFFLVGFFLNSAAVGLYSAAAALSEGLAIIARSAGTVLIARVACQTDEKKLKEFTPAVCRTIMAIIFLAAGFLALAARPAIFLIYSESFAGAAAPLVIMLVGSLALCGWEIISSDLAGRGRQAVISQIAAAAFFAGIFLNILFIPHWGLAGAAWAVNASYFIMFFSAARAYKKISGNGLQEMVLLKKSDIKIYWNFAAAMLKRIKLPL